MTDTPSTDLEVAPAAPPATTEQGRRWNDLYKLARLTTHSEMVPKVLRGRPDAALAVMVYGDELGLRPMTALREIFIIEGTPSCSAKLMRALIYRAGHELRFEEVSRERVVVYGERRDGLGSGRVTWELDDAKLAGLLGKDVWKRYPRAMLTARATSELARLLFSDCTIGYTPEELTRVDLSGEYEYVDVGDDPVDLDDELEDVEEVDEDTPAHEVAAAILDAEDAQDALWLEEARKAKDEEA